MDRLRRNMSPWKKLLIFIGIFFAMSFVAIIITAIGMLFGQGQLSFQAFATVFIFGGTPIVYCFWDKKPYYIVNLFSRKIKLKWLLYSIIIMILSLPVVEWIARNNSYQAEILSLVTDLSYFGLVKLIIVIAVLPAICEELFFRGIVQKALIKWTGSVLAALVITSVIFSLVHWDADNFFARFFMGILLGLLYQYSGNIYSSIMYHFCNNALASLYMWKELRGDSLLYSTEMPLYFAIVSLVIIVLFIVYNELKNPLSIRKNSRELASSRINTKLKKFD